MILKMTQNNKKQLIKDDAPQRRPALRLIKTPPSEYASNHLSLIKSEETPANKLKAGHSFVQQLNALASSIEKDVEYLLKL
jgi:hypothetical protein